MSIYDALITRGDELVGRLARSEDVDRLSAALEALPVAPILQIYRDLPVCGMGLTFECAAGTASAPGPDFGEIDDDFVRECEHGFYWESP